MSAPTIEKTATDLDKDAARKLTDEIKAGIDAIYPKIVDLYLGRGWIALGYANWNEFASVELGNRLQLTKQARGELVGKLSKIMNQRHIAATVGASLGTVNSDVQKLNGVKPNKSKAVVINGNGQHVDIAAMLKSKPEKAPQEATEAPSEALPEADLADVLPDSGDAFIDNLIEISDWLNRFWEHECAVFLTQEQKPRLHEVINDFRELLDTIEQAANGELVAA